MYTNAQSILGKLQELSAYAADEGPDFILLTESWCNPSINNTDLSIPGYQLENELRRDRSDTLNGLGGGLIVYSKNGLKILPGDNLENDFHQYVQFKVLTSSEPVNIILAYRPPSSSIENLEQLCSLVKNMPKNTIIIGDINLPHIDWTTGQADSKGRRLYEVVMEENVEQLVRFPTHDKGNTLDLVLTNMASNIISVTEDGKLGKSDHCVIITEVRIPKRSEKNRKKILNWKKADYHQIKEYLAKVDWNEVLTRQSVNEAWEAFKNEIKIATAKFVPFSTIKRKSTPKWLTRENVRLVRQKKRAWKIYKLYNSIESRDRYKDLESQVKKKIMNAKRGMEKKLANSNDNNGRQFANYIKSKTKTRTSIGPIKSREGILKSDEKDMADELNSFFASVFTEEDGARCEDNNRETNANFSEVNITESKVRGKILKLKTHSAAGPDGIGPQILREAVNELTKPLATIYKLSLETGQVPEDWKKARVTPIYKKGAKGDPGNYRPVSLTCISCRILESILKDDMMSHLSINGLIKDSQHGFLQGKSCTTNLIVFMDKLTKIIDSGKAADVFYLDFAKAFDKVPHSKLLMKMRRKGINGKVYRWIEAWLADRTQTVKVGDAESRPSKVKSGVPQGSVLGPPLFDIFIDDLDECATLIELLIKFADDTKGIKEINGVGDGEKLQETLDNLVRWAKKWGMQYNIPKCKIMHLGRNNPMYVYKMEGRQLEVVEEEKDIGVIVHKSLKPSKQCRRAAGTATAVLRQLARNFHYRDRNIFRKLYIQYVRPHLEFASPAWSPWLKEDKEVLEKVQIKAVGMISGLKGKDYKEKCTEVGIDTLETRREKQDLLETFKIMKNPEATGRILQGTQARAGAVTRTAAEPYNIAVERARLDIRKHSFTGRVPERWNKLPASVKSSETIQMFKTAMKKYTSFS